MCLLLHRTGFPKLFAQKEKEKKSSGVENAIDTNLCCGVDSTHAPAYPLYHQMHMDHRDTV